MITIDGVDYEFRRLHKCVELAHAMVDLPNSYFKHFSFLMKGSKILSVGWNDRSANSFKINEKLVSYPLGGLHSESFCIKRLQDFNMCRRATLVNVRINKQGELRNSKPCDICSNLLNVLGFRIIYYSTNDGFSSMKF